MLRPAMDVEDAPDARLRLVAGAVRAGFIPLALLSLGSLPDLATVALAAAIALLPVVLEQLLGRRLASVVHVAVASAALVESAGRSLDLYEGHPVPFDLFAHTVEVGAAVAIGLTLLRRQAPAVEHRAGMRLAVALAIGLLVALGWEVIEAVVDPHLPGTLQHGFDDTALDVLAGLAGAVGVALLLGPYWRVVRAQPDTRSQGDDTTLG